MLKAVREWFDDDGEPITNGDRVRVNGEFEGTVRIDENGELWIDDWPAAENIIDSLEKIQLLSS